MISQQFQCTLLTDVILNVKSSSEGPNATLDFIPGSCFLGIVASNYDSLGEKAWEIFHSGKVRFGDAHPALNGVRTLRVAASFYHPKLDAQHYFNFHLMDNQMGQMKQCRTGFYNYCSLPPQKVNLKRQFAIKSAYDKEKRRAKDEQMFGYESLVEGCVFLFEIQSEEEALLEEINRNLVGVKRVGRSRSAQYGLVNIEPAQFEEVLSSNIPLNEGLYTVYADSRLIFMDSFGLPSCQPSAQDLGFGNEAEIIWEKSQIRTFQYAPYNWKRKCYDTDRYGIEKGSVFVVHATSSPTSSRYIGYHNNEGFGKVIYNAPFLSAKEVTIPQEEHRDSGAPSGSIQTIEPSDSALVATLKQRNNDALIMTRIYQKVNQWIEINRSAFFGERMASQWGEIRAISTQCGVNGTNVKEAVMKYISHGVAEKIWEKRTRKKLLSDFIENAAPKGKEWLAVATLASEMAKIAS